MRNIFGLAGGPDPLFFGTKPWLDKRTAVASHVFQFDISVRMGPQLKSHNFSLIACLDCFLVCLTGDKLAIARNLTSYHL
uniref:Uncharacterized protein n=1 Tax=Rhizophora mucronata TaxID=61149 RepID=A0A2P2Q971_RHIMU